MENGHFVRMKGQSSMTEMGLEISVQCLFSTIGNFMILVQEKAPHCQLVLKQTFGALIQALSTLPNRICFQLAVKLEDVTTF
jgi:hypothetical protein